MQTSIEAGDFPPTAIDPFENPFLLTSSAYGECVLSLVWQNKLKFDEFLSASIASAPTTYNLQEKALYFYNDANEMLQNIVYECQ